MALAGVKLDSDSGGFVSNCFPVRGLVKRWGINEADGAWLVAHRAEQRRRFKAVLCTKPRTYSRIREERKKTEDQGIRLSEHQFKDEDDGEIEEDVPTLDGYFLMKHCCVEDPADLCSINIAGQELSDVKEEDLDMFDNVAYINAGENYLPFEAFRGFPALRELEMPLNGLRSLKITNSDFPSLEVLDLSYNNLSQEDVLTVGQLSKLRVLHLTGNNFHNLPQDMSMPYVTGDRKVRRQRFGRLEVLLLDDNKFSDVSVFAALAGLPKLRHINMEKNEISHIPQLKCVEGRVITHIGSESKHHRPSSGRKSARRSKSRQETGVLNQRKASHDLDEKLLGKKEPTGETADQEVKTEEKEKTEEKVGSDGNATQSAAGEQAQKEDDLSLEALLVDDFSLGDLSARIHELEEEAAEVVAAAEKKDKQESSPKEVDEVIPKAFPPFRELRYLNIAYNQISEEDALLAVAAWPMLVHLVIHNNPLTTQHTGDPPLLKRFLSDRLGIKLQRKDEPRLVKPQIEVATGKSRKVSDRVPKVPRSTIEERLQQLAMEAPKPPPAILPEPSQSWLLEDHTLSGLDLETSKRMPLPPITPTPPVAPTPRAQAWGERSKLEGEMKVMVEDEGEEKRASGVRSDDSDAFFMTQVEDQEAEMGQKSKTSKRPARTKEPSGTLEDVNNCSEARYRGYEALLNLDPDDDVDVELPKDIQGNVRALKHVLGHQLVYRDPSVNLDRVKRAVPEFRRVPVPPPKPHKSRQEKVDDLLNNLRTRTTVEEEALSKVLKDPLSMRTRFPEAQRLLGEIQHCYNKVRVSSMKEAHDARKIIDQAFEVLNKPRQTYKPAA